VVSQKLPTDQKVGSSNLSGRTSFLQSQIHEGLTATDFGGRSFDLLEGSPWVTPVFANSRADYSWQPVNHCNRLLTTVRHISVVERIRLVEHSARVGTRSGLDMRGTSALSFQYVQVFTAKHRLTGRQNDGRDHVVNIYIPRGDPPCSLFA